MLSRSNIPPLSLWSSLAYFCSQPQHWHPYNFHWYQSHHCSVLGTCCLFEIFELVYASIYKLVSLGLKTPLSHLMTAKQISLTATPLADSERFFIGWFCTWTLLMKVCTCALIVHNSMRKVYGDMMHYLFKYFFYSVSSINVKNVHWAARMLISFTKIWFVNFGLVHLLMWRNLMTKMRIPSLAEIK